MANELSAPVAVEQPPPVKMASEPVLPIPVAIIDTKAADTAGSPLSSGTVAVTPDHQPNLVVLVVTPFMAVLIRFINQFLTTLVGLVAAGMTPAGGRILKADDFIQLVLTCASLSVAAAGLGLIKDLVTVFGKLEQKWPLLTGSI